MRVNKSVAFDLELLQSVAGLAKAEGWNLSETIDKLLREALHFRSSGIEPEYMDHADSELVVKRRVPKQRIEPSKEGDIFAEEQEEEDEI